MDSTMIIAIVVVAIIAMVAYFATKWSKNVKTISTTTIPTSTCQTCQKHEPCPTFSGDRLGFNFKSNNQNVLNIKNKLQDIINIGQDRACTYVKQTWSNQRFSVFNNIKNGIAEVPNKSDVQCATVKSKAIEEMDSKYKQYKSLLESQISDENSLLLLKNAAEIYPLLKGILNSVVDACCENNEMNADKIIGLMDEVIFSLCPGGPVLAKLTASTPSANTILGPVSILIK